MNRLAPVALALLALATPLAPPVRGDDKPDNKRKVDEAVAKGLEYLASRQHKDGAWAAAGDQYAAPLTALCGMSFLMEGSTPADGKYAANVRRAADWLSAQVHDDGGIGDKKDPRCMYGQGFGVLFLSSVYQKEKDAGRQKDLNERLTKAVAFIAKAQTKNGGWGYVPASEGNDFDEGSTTVAQVQALRAARQAGIDVSKDTADKAEGYLKKSTTAKGGVIYSLEAKGGPERPALTVGALAALLAPKDYDTPLAKQWLRFAQESIPLDEPAKAAGFEEYTQYYYAQVAYGLGDEGYAKLFPDSKPEERLTWGKYRDKAFETILTGQAKGGEWKGVGVGPEYTTACYLTVLQLDKGEAPVYQR